MISRKLCATTLGIATLTASLTSNAMAATTSPSAPPKTNSVASVPFVDICGITNIQNVHETKNKSGYWIMHGKLDIKCNSPMHVFVEGTVSGGLLPGGVGPLAVLQSSSDDRYVGAGKNNTFYVPKKETSSIVCKPGWSYYYTAKVWAVNTWATTTAPADVASNITKEITCR